MNVRRRKILCFLTALCIALPAASCGPFFSEVDFVRQYRPDNPYAKFVAGRLGVPLQSYRVRHLAIAYNVLTGRPLSAEEQRQAIAADAALVGANEQDQTTADGFTAWLKARRAFGDVDGVSDVSNSLTRSAPGVDYEQFPNCLDDAFATAARTLAERQATHGTHSAEVMEWVRGQDKVFSNCGDVPGGLTQGGWRPSAPPPVAVPAVLTNAPRWLAQDRAYQIAAAQFYSVQYDEALKSFQAIAADRSSPWSVIAEYLTARTMIRQATLGRAQPVYGQNISQEAQQQSIAKERAELRQAQAALEAMRGDERMRPLAPAIGHLLDWIALRVDPKAQQAVLAARLHGPENKNFGQDLIDLTYASEENDDFQPQLDGLSASMRMRRKGDSGPGVLAVDAKPGVVMREWLLAVMTDDESTALANWRAHPSNAWLLAAMMSAKTGDALSGELVDAAAKVPESDPGYVAMTYQRLRLMGPTAAMRSDLVRVRPAIERIEGPSTTNMFAAMDGATAPSLDVWLRTAGRVPADTADDSVDAGPLTVEPRPAEQPCGPPLLDKDLLLFTPPATDALNTGMPLTVLARAAESKVLAPNLRFAVAQSTWTRAVLLDRPEIAHRMTPVLVECRAAWKDVLAAYDGARDAKARHVAGLLALMRFASTEPNVRMGVQRVFATYSEYRDNWWSETVTNPSAAANFGAAFNTPSSAVQKSGNSGAGADGPLMASSLSFLSAEEHAAAHTEVMALAKIPPASDYFAAEALDWWRAHPKDPANAGLLGEAMRVARNAPRTDKTAENQHALFDALHNAFPNSEWTKRYTSWE